jgi:hypothetical protein
MALTKVHPISVLQGALDHATKGVNTEDLHLVAKKVAIRIEKVVLFVFQATGIKYFTLFAKCRAYPLVDSSKKAADFGIEYTEKFAADAVVIANPPAS